MHLIPVQFPHNTGVVAMPQPLLMWVLCFNLDLINIPLKET